MKKDKISKKDNKEKEDILNEIAWSIKKETVQKESNAEESELEEDVESGFSDISFRQFMQSSDIKSPVLENIAGSAPRPIFVGGIPQGPTSNSGMTGEKDDFKYLPGGNNSDEPKYIGSDSHISSEPRRMDIANVGRRHDILPEVNQQAFFERASEQRGFESAGVERFERAERFDAERAGRKNPFEREDVKYEKYKPKLPKSW